MRKSHFTEAQIKEQEPWMPTVEICRQRIGCWVLITPTAFSPFFFELWSSQTKMDGASSEGR
ncbi:hypothetical protein TQ38_021160 [Novosphingobium sp. P6W]|nr:hypothetical protein TQ38_021160 [Novosphingobium sp. P6W]